MFKSGRRKIWGTMMYKILHWIFNNAFIAVTLIPFFKYGRFLGIDRRAIRALDKGKHDKAQILSNELLELAEEYKSDWNYNNAIHKAHIVLGSVFIEREDIERANAELIAAGNVSGSPQLSTFGPNMRLAKKLLQANQKDTVLVYLEKCRVFWEMGHEYIDYWCYQIQNDQEPDFGANINY